ncbi:MAG: tRNA (adenosine(37)-N6)-dimethylallyltransferase MiaA, partial [Muribaculaceae bacterium]|nr:tRNA (adenosine(37)-N6)-dimethylallyltransferase MiaA [Muribaculaceae bacterium]
MNKLIVVTGPTASGKTDLAVKLAIEHDTEIISADSRQIYKGIPVVTAVPDESQ